VSAVDITTAKRTITTNVLIDDGGIVVLGGLIQQSHTKSDTKVPLLGSIPLIGNLFKTRKAEGQKNNLMIFIRPKILRDEVQAAYQTESKYNYMMGEEKGYNKREWDIPLLPGVKKPKLDPLPPPPPPSSNAAPAGPDENAKRAKEQDEYDADQLRRLGRGAAPPPVKEDRSVPPFQAPPNGAAPNATPPPPPDSQYSQPPYATEKPGVLVPPPPPQSNTPPEGGR
jgi:Bacterial type II and III secretion system protein